MCSEPTKRQGAVRRQWLSIVKDGNAAWAHLVGSLRAGWQGVIHGVASLAKGLALHGETRLVANALPTR